MRIVRRGKSVPSRQLAEKKRARTGQTGPDWSNRFESAPRRRRHLAAEAIDWSSSSNRAAKSLAPRHLYPPVWFCHACLLPVRVGPAPRLARPRICGAGLLCLDTVPHCSGGRQRGTHRRCMFRGWLWNPAPPRISPSHDAREAHDLSAARGNNCCSRDFPVWTLLRAYHRRHLLRRAYPRILRPRAFPHQRCHSRGPLLCGSDRRGWEGHRAACISWRRTVATPGIRRGGFRIRGWACYGVRAVGERVRRWGVQPLPAGVDVFHASGGLRAQQPPSRAPRPPHDHHHHPDSPPPRRITHLLLLPFRAALLRRVHHRPRASPKPYTLTPTPYALTPTTYTLKPTLYTRHQTPCISNPEPFPLPPTPYPLTSTP